MPGIAAIIGGSPNGECEALVGTMVASMGHVPSDVSGTRFLPHLGVYAGWVAHEGSFAARQSLARGRGEVSVFVAGEWFADTDGAAAGAGAEASCAQPSLVQRYDTEGTSVVARLNGLFAGLLIDAKRRRVVLFNDRYGSERLYVHEQGGRIFVASEAKALLAILPGTRAFDDRGVAQFLEYGSTFDGYTLFRNVELLPAGSLWTFDRPGSSTRRCYFQPAEWECLPPLSDAAFRAQLNDTLARVIPRHAASDARVGISLTGGLDTRMIMACLPVCAMEPICYTYAGLTGETLDARLAARVARQCGLAHQTLRIAPDFLAHFGHHVDRTVFVTDGCAGALTAHEIYLTERARRLAPIRLTGNYGSEVLRGMSTFKPVRLARELLDPGVTRLLAHGSGAPAQHHAHPVSRAVFDEIPSHLFGTLAAARSQLIVRTPYLDNDLVRLAFQAPLRARRSAAPSLELVHRNHAALARIPTDRGLAWGQPAPVAMWRRFFCAATFKADYLRTEGLPTWLSPLDPLLAALSKTPLLGLHKFLSYRTWFSSEVAPYVRDVMADPRTARLSCFDPAALRGIAAAHASGRRNHLPEIHAVLTLEAVDRLLIGGSAAAPARNRSAVDAKPVHAHTEPLAMPRTTLP
jgi:asparagine synthase (glutamine-hydrolysing)